MWTSQQYMVVTNGFYIRLHKFDIYFLFNQSLVQVVDAIHSFIYF